MVFGLGTTPTFGAATTSAPTFGFGTPTATPATRAGGFGTSGGFSFGAPGATSTNTPGFNLGSTASTTTSSSFGFPSLTSTTATSTPSFGGFAGFGATGTTTTSTTGGFGGFGSFGSTGTTSTPSFGFGSQPSTLGSGTTPLFSGFGQTQTTPSTGFSGFGTFNAKPPTTGLGTFGGFGTTSTSLGGVGAGGGLNFGQGMGMNQPQTQQLLGQPQQLSGAEAVFGSVYNCTVFGDERDQVLAKWNLLQAMWGTGKGYYSPSAPPVDYTPQNVLCRFKAVGYSRKPGAEAKDAIIAMTFNKKDQEIKNQESQLVSSLSSILGNKPNLIVTIDAIKPLSDSRSLVLFYVQEKGQNGVRRVPQADLVNYFLQPMQKQQLTNMSIDNVYPYLAPDTEQLKEYLDTPPAGIDARLWKQAQLDNPNPEKLIPVPLIGFNDVRWRARCQEQETKVHQAVLDRIAEDIGDFQRRHSNNITKIAEYKQRFTQLQHRLLKVLVKQEITRNIGIALRPEEEILRSQLEALQTQINMPTHFKGRLNELLSQMRMQRQEASQREIERYSMDPAMQEDVKQYLMMEQNGMSHLIEVIQNDLMDLKLMKEGMSKLLSTN